MMQVSIPEISQNEVLRRYEQVKPVIRVKGDLYWLRQYSPDELNGKFNFSYLPDMRNKIDENDLEVIEDFICLHSIKDPSVPYEFRPSISEILAQISFSTMEKGAFAFEIINAPLTMQEFYNTIETDNFARIAYQNKYHVSKVRVYKLKFS